jgi:hypothetical protein
MGVKERPFCRVWVGPTVARYLMLKIIYKWRACPKPSLNRRQVFVGFLRVSDLMLVTPN